MEVKEVQIINMVPAANPVQEAMEVKEMRGQLEIQVRESFHNKEEVLKEVKEIPEETATETEEVK